MDLVGPRLNEGERGPAALVVPGVETLEVVEDHLAGMDAQGPGGRRGAAGLAGAVGTGCVVPTARPGPGDDAVVVARARGLRSDPDRQELPPGAQLSHHPGRGEVALLARPVDAADVDPDAGEGRGGAPAVHHLLTGRAARVECVAGPRRSGRRRRHRGHSRTPLEVVRSARRTVVRGDDVRRRAGGPLPHHRDGHQEQKERHGGQDGWRHRQATIDVPRRTIRRRVGREHRHNSSTRLVCREQNVESAQHSSRDVQHGPERRAAIRAARAP